MRKKEQQLIKIKHTIEGVCNVAVSGNMSIFKAEGIKGRNLKMDFLCKY